MAGVKGRSGGSRPNTGGKRPGAGRKPKVSPAKSPNSPEPQCLDYSDPLTFLRAVWKGEAEATAIQVRAASAALPFVHQKLGEGGKKEQKQAEANKVASRFSTSAPPKLVVNNGK